MVCCGRKAAWQKEEEPWSRERGTETESNRDIFALPAQRLTRQAKAAHTDRNVASVYVASRTIIYCSVCENL